MKSVLGVMMLALGLVACAVEPSSEPTGAVASAVSTNDERSAISESEELLDVTCVDVWECEICGSGNRTQNVLMKECSDGSATEIRRGPCGQPCF